ncbi:hypothetical protein BKA82DRAFT_430920 [Pisolithus tinctorius]|uniref:Uncharacterized protein n=1 Tax=Pisolithus tinctorius Marx 270 TaxID=870435 RepID=A0A0C3PFU5_PISTI|nr:hypothetical protein BKA82DRAFT_430920 [Pisolithus tinctorius]KIO07191.1 hypothetical protein M404DRAFT_430920 [Pisolithus tinctorius Marx 270]
MLNRLSFRCLLRPPKQKTGIMISLLTYLTTYLLQQASTASVSYVAGAKTIREFRYCLHSYGTWDWYFRLVSILTCLVRHFFFRGLYTEGFFYEVHHYHRQGRAVVY